MELLKLQVFTKTIITLGQQLFFEGVKRVSVGRGRRLGQHNVHWVVFVRRRVSGVLEKHSCLVGMVRGRLDNVRLVALLQQMGQLRVCCCYCLVVAHVGGRCCSVCGKMMIIRNKKLMSFIFKFTAGSWLLLNFLLVKKKSQFKTLVIN